MTNSIQKFKFKLYRDGFALQFVSGQFGEGPVGVLPPVHADEGAAPGGYQVDREDLPVLTESVRQFLLLHQFAQVANPQRRAADTQKFLFDVRKSPSLPVAILFSFQTLLFTIFSVSGSRPSCRATSRATSSSSPSIT